MGDSYTSATPMRNSDFKALLTTPRTAGGGAQQQQREGSSFKHPRPKAPADPDRDKKFKKPHPRRPGKPGAAGDKQKEGEEGPLYRDRAKERRDGLNIDFADAEQELAARGLGPTALQSLSIEQSKFLGGDIAHTHLVKGLDYALLNQQRQKLESGGSDGGSGSGPTAAQNAAAAAAAAAVAEAAAAAAKASVKFSTPLGRSVYHAVFRPVGGNRNLVREMFQPRRTAFVFEFGEGGSDVPTTLRRSKADCPAVQDVVSAVSDASLLERISKVMGYINQTSVKGGKRSARDSQYIRSILTGVNPAAPGDGQVHGQLVMKGQAALSAAAAGAAGGPAAAAAGQPGGQPAGAAAAAAAGGDVEDDDIFGDAGTDYAPALPQKKETGGRRAEGLFENKDHQADLVLPPPPAVGEGGGEVDMDIEEGELPGQQRRQQQQAAAAAAAAAQGYPGYPAPGAGDYYQQQQAGWQQQQYGQDAYAQLAAPQQEQPKWRVSTKPGAAGASAASSALQGFADEAYAECFPTMADYNVVEEDEEEDPKKARAAAAAEAAAGGGAPGGGGKGGKGGRGGGGAGGGGLDDAERKLQSKLSREVQQMQGYFEKKDWGHGEAFKKKKDKLDEVAATPARKRLRI